MNIKKLLFSSIFFLTIISGVFAQENNLTGSVLWEISGKGLISPSYIIGTNHIITKGILDDIKGIEEALSNTEQVVGEIDMDETVLKGNFLQNIGMMPDSITYNELLSEQDYAVLDANLKAVLHVGLEKLSKLNPVTINTLYAIALYNNINGYKLQAEPMDAYFQRIAKENNKPIIGLESLEDQIQVLYYSSSIEKQVQDLFCQTSNVEYISKMMKQLDVYYKEGNLNSLLEIMNDENDPCPSSDEEKSQMNKDRNDKWLVKLPSIMADKASFIAVGCMHIAGEDGLLFQLQQMGYTVKAVK